MIWDEVFNTGIIPDNTSDKDLCATGICGWANCMIPKSQPIPEKFGVGVVAIGQRLGIAATCKNLENYAKNKKWIKK